VATLLKWKYLYVRGAKYESSEGVFKDVCSLMTNGTCIKYLLVRTVRAEHSRAVCCKTQRQMTPGLRSSGCTV
jgi:hypothetical protein